MWQPGSILVTGGCGFIGSNFVNYMFDKWPAAKFVIIDRLDVDASELNIEKSVRESSRYKFVKGCLQEMKLVIKLLEEHKIDTVIHFAAITHVDKSYSDRVGTIRDNILSTTCLLEAIHFHSVGVRRFVHISTDEVYGDSVVDEAPKTEFSPLNPTNPYAASKGACELILNSYWHSYKVPFVMVRMNNVYGPRQACSKLIPKFTTLALEKKPYPLMGDGQHTRSWMYVDDCTEAIKRITESGKIGETYNIGTDFEKTNFELTVQIHDIVEKLMNRQKSKPVLHKIADRPYHDRRYYIDFSKIRNEMNWTCTVPFNEGLLKTVEYYVEIYQADRTDPRIRGSG